GWSVTPIFSVPAGCAETGTPTPTRIAQFSNAAARDRRLEIMFVIALEEITGWEARRIPRSIPALAAATRTPVSHDHHTDASTRKCASSCRQAIGDARRRAARDRVACSVQV